MDMLAHFVVATYVAVLLALTAFGFHRYFLFYLFSRHMKTRRKAPSSPCPFPGVTIQLPVFNEKYVVERLLEAVADLDYPRKKLSIQVLDDSTDETTAICQRRVTALKARGFDIEFFHRDNRAGFKAGALERGLVEAPGELIAIFDADFVPPPSFLRDTVRHFEDPEVGMVQVRWGYINENYSLLTRVQAMLLDGHFIVEHSARNWSNRFFNFNGTAGIWRKGTILDAGGWQHDTLTEDLDLSYRAQMRGWKFIYLLDVTCPSEVPVDIGAFKSQQHRWAKGSIETAFKLLPVLFSSDLPLRVKIESFFHLGANSAYFLLLSLVLLTFPAMVVRIEMGWHHVAWFDLFVFLGAFGPSCLFYVLSHKILGRPWAHRLLLLPLLICVGIGLSVNNARAVWQAMRKKRTDFVRTPKYRIEQRREKWWTKGYGRQGDRGQIVELLLAAYCAFPVAFAIHHGVYLSIPFLLLFVVGFGYVGVLTWLQKWFCRESAVV